jgi:hypothetical protein
MYSAAGKPNVAAALVSARSSLRHNPVPHVLFAAPPPTDAGSAEGLSIEPFEASGNPYLDKIANMRRSPFERTIFLDSDTYVTREIVHLFELLDRYEIAAALAPGYRGLNDPDVPAAFSEFNTGVVAWRACDRVAEFMSSWQETYAAWQSEPPFDRAGESRGKADQPAFRRCAWQHGMRIVVLPPEYNYRTGEPATVVGPVRVVHGRHEDYRRVAAVLNERMGARAFPPLGPAGEPLTSGA